MANILWNDVCRYGTRIAFDGNGTLFKVKGQGNLSRWGMLIAISGACCMQLRELVLEKRLAIILIIWVHLKNMLDEGGALHSVSWIVGILSVAELTFEQVINILKVSLFIGIIHLVWAMILRVRRLAKEGQKL